MNVSEKDNAVLAMDVARDDTELFVVTENGFGKRTPIADYPVKGRGTKGVKTIQMTERKGALAGALIVREHQELVFISQSGHGAAHGRARDLEDGPRTQGVKVMNLRGDDTVSAVALVVESDADARRRRAPRTAAHAGAAQPTAIEPRPSRETRAGDEPQTASRAAEPRAGTAARPPGSTGAATRMKTVGPGRRGRACAGACPSRPACGCPCAGCRARRR